MLVLDTSVSWQAVALAAIAATPGIIAAWKATTVAKAIKTPSGTSIGRQVENAHHVALSNNYRLQAMSCEGNGEELRTAQQLERGSVPTATPETSDPLPPVP